MQHWGIPSRFKPSRECGISAKAIINTGSRKRVGKRFRAGASGARQASQSKSGSPEPGFFLWNILNPRPVLGVANNQLGTSAPAGWRKPRLHESRGFLFDLVGSFSPFSGMRRCWE